MREIAMKNIFIEGLQGSGKSTLLSRLARELKGYQVYYEGDISPVELGWCSYMTEKQYQEIIKKYSFLKNQIITHTCQEQDHYIVSYTRVLAETRDFYEHMEAFEIYNGRIEFETFRRIIMKRYRKFYSEGNLFECSFFQNTIETMMLFYQMKEDAIIDFYREAYGILKEKSFQLIYLDTLDIRKNILQIKKERSDDLGNEMWFPLMMNYLRDSPYGREHHCQGIDDLICHLEQRKQLEHKIIEEFLEGTCLIIPARSSEAENMVISEL